MSAYWNGAATYYRGIVRALAARGHRITFYEPDAYDRQQHRDIADPPWAEVVVYPATRRATCARALERARAAPTSIVKASGVGVFDELLEARGARAAARRSARRIFWDVDAPATLDRVQRRPARSVPRADPALRPRPHLRRRRRRSSTAYRALGARAVRADLQRARSRRRTTRSPPDPRFAADLGVPRQPPARPRGARRGVLPRARPRALPGRAVPARRQRLGRQAAARQRALRSATSTRATTTRFNCTPRAVLNISRDSMARYGFSPATRVFEAAGAGACLITDAWEGIELFLEPGARGAGRARRRRGGRARSRELDAERARARSARPRAARVLAEHTYAHRAAQVEAAAREARPARAERRRDDGCDIVILGLSITSSWGNGHATTYRGLVRALAARGHDVAVPRARPALVRRATATCRARRTAAPTLYGSARRAARPLRAARCARPTWSIVGSYVPDGVAVGDWVHARRRAASTAFYDIDTPVTLAQARARATTSTSRRDLIPRYDLYLSFTGGPTLARLERELRRAARRGRSTARSTRSVLPPRAGAAALGPRLPRHLQRRSPAGARAAAARAGARAGPSGASSSPGRSTRTTIALARQRRAHRAPRRPPSTARFYSRAALHAERHARRHGRAPAARRACACSRPPPAASRSSATLGRARRRSSRRAARSWSRATPEDDAALSCDDARRERAPRDRRAAPRARPRRAHRRPSRRDARALHAELVDTRRGRERSRRVDTHRSARTMA